MLSWEVPAAVIAFALIAAFGPLSAVQLSIRSQARRAAAILDEVGVDRAVAKAPGPRRIELALERYDELAGALRQLAKLGGEPAVRQVLTGSTTECVRSWQIAECLRRLGVDRRGTIEPVRPSGTTTVLRARGRFPSAAGEVEWIEIARQPDQPDPPLPSTGSNVSSSGQGLVLAADRVILLAGGAVVAQAPIAPLIAPPRSDDALPLRTLALVRPDGTIAADLAVEELQLWEPEGRAGHQLVGLTAIVIWRR